jgi:hypothetical protein
MFSVSQAAGVLVGEGHPQPAGTKKELFISESLL